MVERYKRLNYHIHQLERPIAINEGLSGIDVIELMAYLRQDNKPKQHYSKGRYSSL